MTVGPSGQTVLVTGGAGFIGSHLCEAAAAANEVRVLDDFSSGRRANPPDGVTVIEGDVRDEATCARALEGVDIVFHLAAQIDVQRSVDDPQTSHSINTAGTLSLLEQARERDVRVVLASSAAIYGSPTELPIAEDDPPDPCSPYAVEKLAADRYAGIYHDLYGLQTVVLRYFNVYGPRQHGGAYNGVVSTFLQQAEAGGPITVHGDGTQTRDFVHVHDVVDATLRAATAGRYGEAFNVGTSERTSIRRLAETVSDVIEPDASIVHTSPRPGDVRHSEADISKAREQLSFEPAIGLREGIESLRDGAADAPDGVASTVGDSG